MADQSERRGEYVTVPRMLLERAERELGAWEDGFEAFTTDDPNIREDLRTALAKADGRADPAS